MTVTYLACLALGYLIGSLSVSILISKYIFHQDVRTLGSGNAGAANAARTLGAGVGLLTLLGDFLKGVISMLLGSCLGGATGLAIAGAACMIGHCFPIYFGFKGGKAVATAAAVALMIDWRVFLSAFAVFAIIAALSKTASVSSMSASVAVAAMTPVFTRNRFSFRSAFSRACWCFSCTAATSEGSFRAPSRTFISANTPANNNQVSSAVRKSADRFFLDSAAISLYNIAKRYRVAILEPLRKGGIICRADRWKI